VFRPTFDVRKCKYIWLGTTLRFDAFQFLFEENEHGVFQAHAYPFEEGTSTFIVECDDASFKAAGLGEKSIEEGVAYCERLFAKHLKGHRLLSNASTWISFPTVKTGTWHHRNLVILGDAAHTAHFSIGSGTKLAMEDAIGLAKALADNPGSVPAALAAYEEERRPMIERFQKAAQDSLVFFENIKRYAGQSNTQFAFNLLTRSKRITYDNLRLRDPGFVEQVTREFTARCKAEPTSEGELPPPMFTPFSIRGMRVENRVVVSPMCMYSAHEGVPNDFHLVHYGARAMGGAGLLFTEMTDVSREARITPGCTGMYAPEHVTAWKRIVDFVHERSKAKFCLQLGHAGRKGSTRLLWEGMDEPLETGNWPIVAASPIPYYPHGQVPREMTRKDMDEVVANFARAAKMADEAGFDMIEVHMAHGYLLAGFLSPLTNVRTDEYGGPIANRLRFPLEVFDGARAAFPKHKPMSVRISATDWAEGGLTDEDCLAIARALAEHGCDIIDVSAGQTVADAKPVFGRMFQTPFSDLVRHGSGLPTIAVGNISSGDQVNTIVAAGRADLCALARPHLDDPAFTLHAAKEQGYPDVFWPNQYILAKPRPRPKAV
jgi:anthraniloyl-CoA monooxygenase